MSLLLLCTVWAPSLEGPVIHTGPDVAGAAPLRLMASPFLFLLGSRPAAVRQLFFRKLIFGWEIWGRGLLHLSGIIIVRSVLRQSEVAAPSLKTYCFACTRRQLLKNQAFHVHGNTNIYTDRGTHFPAARNCTHFDAEGLTFFFTFCDEQPISERMQFLRSRQTLASASCFGSGVQGSHTEFENIWFCVHENSGFEKSGVSPTREHQFVSRLGRTFSSRQKLHAF